MSGRLRSRRSHALVYANPYINEITHCKIAYDLYQSYLLVQRLSLCAFMISIVEPLMPLKSLCQFFVLVTVASGRAVPDQDRPLNDNNIRETAFQHPGLLHSASDFERIVPKVKSKEQPWYTGWTKLTHNTNLSYVAQPHETVIRGTNADAGPENFSDLFRDIAAAYNLAARWKIEGDESYAITAANILDDWASTLQSITGTSDKYLASGLYGYQIANVAEILRSYSGWNKLNDTIAMLETKFYPLSHEFLRNHNGAEIDHYWANWDLCNIATIQAIGILSDNSSMYDEAIDYYKSGAGNGQIEKAIWKLYDDPDSPGKKLGQCQESGRDQGHAMLNFALHGVIAQQGWSQGDDLFGYLDSRILAG